MHLCVLRFIAATVVYFFAHEMTIMPVNHSQGMSAKILFIPWHDGVDAFNRAP